MNKIILIGISPLILASAFFLPYIGDAAAFVGFAPFLYGLRVYAKTLRQGFWYGMVAGCVLYAITLSWLFTLLPLEWAGVESRIVAYSIGLPIWVGIVMLFSLWWGVFGVGYVYLSRQRHVLGTCGYVSAVACFWVVCEYTRAYMLGALLFSSGHTILSSVWTFSNAVYGMTGGWAVMLASLGGIYFIDGILMLVNTSLVEGMIMRARSIVVWGVVLVICAELVGYALSRASLSAEGGGHIIHVAALRSDIPRSLVTLPDVARSSFQEMAKAVVSYPGHLDVVIAPEGGDILSESFRDTGKDLRRRLQDEDILVIDHVYRSSSRGLVSKTLYWLPHQGTVASQGKEFLVPGGEYVPWAVERLLYMLGQDRLVESFEDIRGFIPSEKGSPAFLGARGAYTTLVCSEIYGSQTAREAVRAGAEVLFLQTSDALFRGNALYERQMLAMAQLRAIESGRYVVRASNAGTTVVIRNNGNIVSRLLSGNGILTEEVPLVSSHTLYDRVGDLPVLASLFYIGVMVVVIKRRSANF